MISQHGNEFSIFTSSMKLGDTSMLRLSSRTRQWNLRLLVLYMNDWEFELEVVNETKCTSFLLSAVLDI